MTLYSGKRLLLGRVTHLNSPCGETSNLLKHVASFLSNNLPIIDLDGLLDLHFVEITTLLVRLYDISEIIRVGFEAALMSYTKTSAKRG